MTNRTAPWNELATARQDVATETPKSVTELMEEAGLNYNVTLQPGVAFDSEGNTVTTDRFSNIVREDGVILGQGSATYGLIQNEVMNELASTVIAQDPRFKATAAGHMDHGSFTFVQLQADAKDFGSGETISRDLLISKSFNGKYPLSGMALGTRFFCQNQLRSGWKNGGIFKVRHTRHALNYVDNAHRILETTYKAYDDFDRQVEILLNTERTRDQFFNMVRDISGERPTDEGRGQTMWDNRFDGIVAAYDAPQNANIAGTAWGDLMAVNDFELWGTQLRGVSRGESQARRLMGDTAKLTDKARGLLLAGV